MLLNEYMKRDEMISQLEAGGRRYKWDGRSDAEIYRIYQKEMPKIASEQKSAIQKEAEKKAVKAKAVDDKGAEQLSMKFEKFMNEDMSEKNRVKEAISLLYRMDEFVMDSYDNEQWLIYGVPDGEFEDESLDEAEENYKDHDWLLCDAETDDFSIDEFKEFLNTFKACTRRASDYDRDERQAIIDEAENFIINRSGIQ